MFILVFCRVHRASWKIEISEISLKNPAFVAVKRRGSTKMCRACGKLSCSYLRLAPHYDDPKAADRHRNVQKATNRQSDRHISVATSPRTIRSII